MFALLLMLSLSFALSAQAEPLPGGDGNPLDVTLEGSARIGPAEGIEGEALLLDGKPGSYARTALPDGWGNPACFRVEAKVRLGSRRGGAVCLARPDGFWVYFNGEGKPWVVLDCEKRRVVMAGAEPVPTGQWLDIAFEYRADDISLLYVNGRSVAALPAVGPLKATSDELWLGRYRYIEKEKEDNSYFPGAVALPKLTRLPDDDRFSLDAAAMSNAMNLSWGDAIVVGKGWRQLNKKAHVPLPVEECRRQGVKKLFLRTDDEFILRFCKHNMDENHWYLQAIAAVEGDLKAEIIDKCHQAGIEVYAYQSIFDGGSPPEVLYGGSAPFPWQAQFIVDNPQYLTQNRDGTKRQWGVLCYAYPEARRFMVDVFSHYLSKWDFDGVYVCTRTHSYPATFADEFGYNDPIAEEYRRRFGTDIRTEDFDKSKWYDLQGEYLTQLLRDLREALGGKAIYLAIPRSDHIGPPYGNMRLDYPTWCQEKLIDGLVLGVTSGGWHYPNTTNLPGYVVSEQDNLNMRPLEADLKDHFGPACAAGGVELYLQRSSIYSDADRDLLKYPAMKGFMVGFGY